MRWTVGALLMLAGCSGGNESVPQNVSVVETGPAPAITPVATATADATAYLGRWTGVEGMYLVITEKADGVSLEMQYDLDHEGTYDGIVAPDGIRFTRNGEALTLRASTGDDTGLKYLAGKTNCLTVKPGEGYCRE